MDAAHGLWRSSSSAVEVLQIETKLAVERRDELLSVPGVDAVMVGPVDLSISLGVPGEFQHPKMVRRWTRFAIAAWRTASFPALRPGPWPLAKFWKDRGMLFVGCGRETGFLGRKPRRQCGAPKLTFASFAPLREIR